ncbi:MAG: hypothetical protein ACE5E6_08290 [Phycisphaerae bacterium]
MCGWRLYRWSRVFVPGALLMGFGGCLGPNPGFFISTSAANAAISTLIGTWLRDALALGSG